jgi:hypothetical protein
MSHKGTRYTFVVDTAVTFGLSIKKGTLYDIEGTDVQSKVSSGAKESSAAVVGFFDAGLSARG